MLAIVANHEKYWSRNDLRRKKFFEVHAPQRRKRLAVKVSKAFHKKDFHRVNYLTVKVFQERSARELNS